MPVDGGKVTLGFYLKPDSGWHAYWENPGDAGLAPRFKWDVPEGFTISKPAFPTPHVLPFGPLNTYGYDEAILLLLDMSVPADLSKSGQLEISGVANWVVCDDEICVPEKVEISITLPVGSGEADLETSGRFAAARALLPGKVDWPAKWNVDKEQVSIVIEVPQDSMLASDIYAFVSSRRVVKYDSQQVSFIPGGIAIAMNAHSKAAEKEELPLLLTYTDTNGEHKAASLVAGKSSDIQAVPGTMASVESSKGGIAAPETLGGLNLATALFFAFIGGVILNLMPCVFPILSMKALSLVQMSHSDLKEARVSGWLYTIGILVAFAASGATLVAMREAGQAAGWGFQMQSPLAVLAIGLLMLAVALNLFGVFEVGTRLMSTGQSLAEGKGERTASFFTGLLAVVVATPCMAPFMASALGYALSQPVAIAMSIFLVLGLGLASPFLVLSYVPRLGGLMPKPGAWMETFKQILAFPMLVAALYLFWVLGRMLGVNSLIVGLASAVAFAFAAWAYGKRTSSRFRKTWSVLAILGLAVCVIAAYKVPEFKQATGTPTEAHAGTLGKLELEHFTPERVLNYIEEGQPVFVYFTADWCISCKVNERVALASDEVGDGFNKRGIKVVEGDWTSEDPVITEWLEMYDRIGVPLYLYFPEGSSQASPTILPQILTPGMVIEAIDGADAGRVGQVTDTAVPASTPDEQDAPYVVPDVAPDWSVVQAYIDVDTIWHELNKEIYKSDASKEEKERRKNEERGEHPNIDSAVAAATAIVKLENAHEKLLESAEFLIGETRGMPSSAQHMTLGAVTIADSFPAYENWPEFLFYLDFFNDIDANKELEDFLENAPMLLSDPIAIATARYYRASRLMRLANAVSTPTGDRSLYRDKAIAIATDLSAGVEDEELTKSRRFNDEGEPIPFPSLKDSEDDLLYNLQFLSVGNKIPDVAAANLSGMQDSVSNYQGETLLLDFWATWCGPCIASLPKLHELDQYLPADQFEILSISVDAEIETVTEFQLDEPMPWANWHVGPKAELLRTWAVRGFPTYLLVDHEGIIIARQHDLTDEFAALIKSTACGRDESSC